MSEITGLNGAPLVSEKKTVKVTLEMDLVSGKLAIGGDITNLDQALNVIGQAQRWLEARYNIQQQLIAQAEIQRDQQLFASMTRQ